MDYQTILVTVENRIATVTLNRPEYSNAFARESYVEIANAMKDLGSRRDVGSIVVTGAGRHFSAGGDIKRFKALIDSKEYLDGDSVADAGNMSIAIRECPKPCLLYTSLLKICQGHAGFSTANFPLLKMNIAYRQAVTAARYGMMLNPETGIYFYSHYYIYEMLDDYKKRYALEDMSVQKLALLSDPAEDRYDNLALLRNYLLTERSISSTAKIMHMHRNSVIYRLNKIQELSLIHIFPVQPEYLWGQ